MTQNILQLVKLAKLVRHKVELLAAKEEGPPNLLGYCGIASYTLSKLAETNGIDCKLVYGWFCRYNRLFDEYFNYSGHVWVESDDRIVDITATQFEKVSSKIKRNFNQKVYVCGISNPHYMPYLVGNDVVPEITTWHDESMEDLAELVLQQEV